MFPEYRQMFPEWRSHRLEDLHALLVGARLQQLLHEVVPKGVHHQLHHVLQDLREDYGHSRGAAFVEFALQEAAPVLVPSQAQHLSLQNNIRTYPQNIITIRSGTRAGPEPGSAPVITEHQHNILMIMFC
jgi:hypothetical protein